jgi:hypothetical protein
MLCVLYGIRQIFLKADRHAVHMKSMSGNCKFQRTDPYKLLQYLFNKSVMTTESSFLKTHKTSLI